MEKLTEHWQDAGPTLQRSGSVVERSRLLIAPAIAGGVLRVTSAGPIASSLVAAFRRDGVGMRTVWWLAQSPGHRAARRYGLGWSAGPVTSPAQRNVGSPAYLVGYGAWGLLMAVTIAATVRAALRREQRLEPPAQVVKPEKPSLPVLWPSRSPGTAGCAIIGRCLPRRETHRYSPSVASHWRPAPRTAGRQTWVSPAGHAESHACQAHTARP